MAERARRGWPERFERLAGSKGGTVDARDRRFLDEYIRFSGPNHIVATIALFRAGLEPERTAETLHELTDNTDSATAAENAGRLNTAARVQSILVGRLIAELAATAEDVGGLGWAIRHRRKGLLSTYIRSSVGEAAMFLDLARRAPRLPLESLLGLPDLATVEDRFEGAAAAAIAQDYARLPDALAQLGDAYRAPGAQVTVTSGTAPPADKVHVLLDVLDPGRPPAQPTPGLLPATLNKLKHRFTLIEDVEQLGALAGSPLLYTHLGRDPKTVDALVKRIVYVTRLGIEVATLLAILDDAGLDAAATAGRGPDPDGNEPADP